MTVIMAQLEHLNLALSYFRRIFPAYTRRGGGYGCVGLAVGASSALST